MTLLMYLAASGLGVMALHAYAKNRYLGLGLLLAGMMIAQRTPLK